MNTNEISAVLGYIDEITAAVVSGWAIDRSRPHSSVELALLVNGVEHARLSTSEQRQDVAWLHDCTPRCGFRFNIPARALTSSKVTIRVVEIETGVSLTPSAQSQTAGPISLNFAQEAVDLARLRTALHLELSDSIERMLRLNANPDVRLKGLDPGLANIFIINGAKGMHAELFRTYALANALRAIGYSPVIFDVADVVFLPHSGVLASFFIRTSLDGPVSEFVSGLRKNKVRVISDFDDLVFRPSLIDTIDGVRYLTREQRDAYAKGMGLYRQMLETSDAVWVTTNHLAEEARRFNRNVQILRNFPLASARKAASEVAHVADEGQFVIGYYSGTLTHQADFQQCSTGLKRFLDEYPQSKLRIVGQLELEDFQDLNSHPRVDRVGLMSYEDMVRDIAKCDVVIAPLEVGDPFCESKSELKYFDAALVGVPVVASPTGAYCEAIESGSNGFLAEKPEEWFCALQTLCED
ncbi:MAG: glycosyltransferase, partial [Rhodocyclaceae bacterium]|nr:glycosyltransferase [Rhodocyclaceae bacterium]